MTFSRSRELLQVNNFDFVPRLTDFDRPVSQIDRAVACASDKFLQIEGKPVDLVLEFRRFRFLPVCDEINFLLCDLF